MRISCLVHDLSGNCLVRTYPIAKVLERYYEVEVIGPVSSVGNEIFEPYKNEFSYRPVLLNQRLSKLSKIGKGILGIKDLVDRIRGDVIYAFKPLVTSFGIGLLAKHIRRIPLILDIEDWEAERFYDCSYGSKLTSLLRFYDPSSMLYTRLMELLPNLADEITVGSNFLQRRFGGIKLPHGADCDFFDPSKYDREKLRKRHGLTHTYTILFAGTPHRHKGLEELIEALEILSLNTVLLLVVGHQTEYLKELKEEHNAYIMAIGPRPHVDMSEFLSLADLVVLPQLDVSFAQAQVPGKVYEAMAMAKPIIASAISDLPEILDGCGCIVEPENPEKLAEAIRYVLDHPKEADEMGWKARERCIKRYSWDAMEKILIKIFRKYE